MLTLYYKPGACSLASHIVLEWIGQPYGAIAVDTNDPAYREINPAGAVPALRLADGMVLTQSAAVLKYLAATHPALDLLGDGSVEATAEIDRWSAFLTGDLHPSFFPLFRPDRYTTDPSEHALARVREAGLALVAKQLGLLERQLAGHDWIAGERRSYVDAYAVPMLRWARAKLDLGQFPSVAAHLARMLGDAGVQRALKAEGLS